LNKEDDRTLSHPLNDKEPFSICFIIGLQYEKIDYSKYGFVLIAA